MAILSIDIETYSDVDLSKCGVYAYSNSPNFEILLFAYAFDEEPTRLVDLACGERLPERVLVALEDASLLAQHGVYAAMWEEYRRSARWRVGKEEAV